MTAMADIITRDFTCDPALIGMDAINATGRNEYVTDSVVNVMPRATVSTGQIHFFKVGAVLEARQLMQEAFRRGLRLVDPHTLAAFNAANPKFADTHSNGTEWEDESGNACYATFNEYHGERRVFVRRGDDGWDGGWWFAGFSE